MRILQEKLDDAFAGKGSLVMLAGEAGIGKTSIAQYFAEMASHAGAQVLQGCCFEGDWQPTYGPWVEALDTYVRSSTNETVLRQLGHGVAPLAQLVGGIREALPEIPPLSPLSTDEERSRLYDAVIQFLFAIAQESPVLLLLDDLHWADRDSLRLLRHMVRFVGHARIMVLGVYRDAELDLSEQHPLADLLAVLRREVDYEQIVVQGLDLVETEEYLAEVGGRPLPKALVHTIYASTNGNPFYVRQVFRHLAEEGKILERAGRWSTDLSLGELGIPTGVRQVLNRRISRLSQETNVLLRLASGFTGGFTFQVLQTLSQLPEDTLLNSLDEALRARLIRVGEGSPVRYHFVHAIVKQTIYEELNPERRARLHRNIAVALEQVYAGRQMEHAAELAVQYHASASLPGTAKSSEYALAAAEQARNSSAYERAVDFLQMARNLATEREPRERANILCRLTIGEAEALMLDDAIRTAREAMDCLSFTGVTVGERVEFLTTTARLLKEGGASASVWENLVEEGLNLLGETRDLPWARLKLLCEYGDPVAIGLVNGSRLQRYDPLAVTIARAQGSEEDYARTLELFGYRTREETERILEVARTWHQPTAIFRALDIVARDMLYCHGAFGEAVERYKELLATGERYGSILWQAEALTQLAMAQVTLGNLDIAQSTVQHASEMIERLGAAHGLRFIQAGLHTMLTLYLGGDWGALSESLSQFATSLEAGWSPAGLGMSATAAFTLCKAGNVVEARRFLTALTPIIEETEPTVYGHNLVVGIASYVVWELRDKEYASKYFHLSLNFLEAGIGPSFLGPHELAVARMAAILDKRIEAVEYFARARTYFEQRGMLHQRAIADLDEAIALTWFDGSDRARILDLLDGALTTFNELGMRGWVLQALEQKKILSTPSRSKHKDRRSYADGLTAQEVKVLGLLAIGKTNKEIAAELVVSVATAERHIANIYTKIDIRRRSEAVAYAISHGLAQKQES